MDCTVYNIETSCMFLLLYIQEIRPTLISVFFFKEALL